MERTIPQRELRNNIAEVLREAEAGVEFTITVRGRPVATLGPPRTTSPQVDLEFSQIAALLDLYPADDHLSSDLAALPAAEAPVDNPWSAT